VQRHTINVISLQVALAVPSPDADRALHVRRLPALAHQFGSFCEILFATEQPVLLELGELAQLLVEVRLGGCVWRRRFAINIVA
jgi:hypothetical protein